MTQDDMPYATDTLTEGKASALKTSIASSIEENSKDNGDDAFFYQERPAIEVVKDDKSPNTRLETAISQQFFVIEDQNNGTRLGDTVSSQSQVGKMLKISDEEFA